MPPTYAFVEQDVERLLRELQRDLLALPPPFRRVLCCTAATQQARTSNADPLSVCALSALCARSTKKDRRTGIRMVRQAEDVDLNVRDVVVALEVLEVPLLPPLARAVVQGALPLHGRSPRRRSTPRRRSLLHPRRVKIWSGSTRWPCLA